MRKGIVVNVNGEDRLRLAAIVANRNSPQKHVWRVRIILLTADGLGTAEIMRRNGLRIDAVVEEGGLALHASSVRLGGTVLLFSGPAGAGKTTAATAFPPSDRLDDDMALIAERAGEWVRLDAFDARDPRRFGPGDVGELRVRALFLPFPAAAFTAEVLKGAAAVKACLHIPPKALLQKGTTERILDAASRFTAKVPVVRLGWSPKQNLPLLLSNFL